MPRETQDSSFAKPKFYSGIVCNLRLCVYSLALNSQPVPNIAKGRGNMVGDSKMKNL